MGMKKYFMIGVLMRLIIIFLLISLMGNYSYAQNDLPVIYQNEAYDFPYQLLEPHKTIILDPKLKEISGIEHIGNDRIVCVQDEKAHLYFLNFTKNEIYNKIKFGDPGDFEDLAIVGDDAWAVKSNGDLYRIKNYLSDDFDVKRYETRLKKKNDCEGLAFDAVNNRLLIACKGHPFHEDKKAKKRKAIYAFNLENKKLEKDPVFLLDLEEIKENRSYNTLTSWGLELMALLDENKGDLSFQPSGISVHPFTGNLYLIASVGDLLMVLSPEGEVLTLVDLNDRLFNQPEGICFDEAGNLYISNEAKEHKPSIHQFEIKKP